MYEAPEYEHILKDLCEIVASFVLHMYLALVSGHLVKTIDKSLYQRNKNKDYYS